MGLIQDSVPTQAPDQTHRKSPLALTHSLDHRLQHHYHRHPAAPLPTHSLRQRLRIRLRQPSGLDQTKVNSSLASGVRVRTLGGQDLHHSRPILTHPVRSRAHSSNSSNSRTNNERKSSNNQLLETDRDPSPPGQAVLVRKVGLRFQPPSVAEEVEVVQSGLSGLSHHTPTRTNRLKRIQATCKPLDHDHAPLPTNRPLSTTCNPHQHPRLLQHSQALRLPSRHPPSVCRPRPRMVLLPFLRSVQRPLPTMRARLLCHSNLVAPHRTRLPLAPPLQVTNQHLSQVSAV